MRILLTNNGLSVQAGSELYLCEVAEELKARGHEPACFSLTVGPLAERLREKGIPVSDDLRTLPGPPDVIHGQHLIETTLAAMTYRYVPVISFCHGPEAWQESACQLPNVVRWIAVDQACRQRLIHDEGIDAARIVTLLNHFDDRKFRPRDPLPAQPARALLVSNYLEPDHPAVQAVQAACAARGIALTTAGRHLGGTSAALELMLPHYDLVFAKARTAIEALGVGCAVVQIDYFGAGRMIRTENLDELRPLNFGFRSMTFPLSAEYLGSQIDLYDAADAALVSARIRQEATLDGTMRQLLSLYEEAIAEQRSLPDYDAVLAAADFLRFQLYLSKLPLDAIVQTDGVPLRLPLGRIPADALAQTWSKLIAPHVLVVDREMGKLAATLHDTLEKHARAITEAQTQIATLEDNLAALEDKLAVFKEKRRLDREKIDRLKVKIALLSPKPTFRQRLRRFLRLPPPR